MSSMKNSGRVTRKGSPFSLFEAGAEEEGEDDGDADGDRDWKAEDRGEYSFGEDAEEGEGNADDHQPEPDEGAADVPSVFFAVADLQEHGFCGPCFLIGEEHGGLSGVSDDGGRGLRFTNQLIVKRVAPKCDTERRPPVWHLVDL